MGSPPPLGRPSSESPLCVGISPQIPPLSSLLLPGELVAASLGGQRLRSVPPRMVISFIVMQRLISLSCARTEQIDCKYYFVMVILHEHWSRPKKTLAFWARLCTNCTICSNFSPTLTFTFLSSFYLFSISYFYSIFLISFFNILVIISFFLFFISLSPFLSFLYHFFIIFLSFLYHH